MKKKIHFIANGSRVANAALKQLIDLYGQINIHNAEIIIALGGDGFMLDVLHKMQPKGIAVYGMNCGTVGFLMNAYSKVNLLRRLAYAEQTIIHPLSMRAQCRDTGMYQAFALNEVSLLRAGAQAAKLRILVDGKIRMPNLVCDGALLSTPAGSTAYNYSAHGPILPIGANILALTAISSFRPRRWRGALLPKSATVHFEVLEPQKRPVSAAADSKNIRNVLSVEVTSAPNLPHRILFDPGHGLEERLIREQFT